MLMVRHSRLLAVLATMVLVVGMVAGTVASAVAGGDLPPGGTFTDDNGNIHEGNIEAIAAEGITKGCNPAQGNTKFCPGSTVSRGQMAAFLVRALGLPATSVDFFTDDDGSVFEADINRLAASGITKGCNPAQGNTKYCPDNTVTRGQMAAFLVRAFGYSDDGGGGLFIDTGASIFAAAIDRLAVAGVTKGCNPQDGNTKYCPSNPVKRDQMATFLTRALGLTPNVPPPVTTPPPTTPPPTTGACSGDIEIPLSECTALVALYTATNGDSWLYNFDWLTSGDGYKERPCGWYGVTCNGSAGNRNVYSLTLGSNKLSGSIPPEIGDFPDLFEIMFTGNQLTGTLPAELGDLSSLSKLKVNGNPDLGGEIPTKVYTGLKDTLTQFSMGGTLEDGGTCYTVPSNAPAGMVPWLYGFQPTWDADC